MDYEKYKNTLPYPSKIAKPVLKDATSPAAHRKYADELEQYEKDMIPYREALKAWNAHGRDLQEQFKTDLIEELGITGHPKAELLYSIAWQMGHSSGYSDVHTHATDMVDLLHFDSEEMKVLIGWRSKHGFKVSM